MNNFDWLNEQYDVRDGDRRESLKVMVRARLVKPKSELTHFVPSKFNKQLEVRERNKNKTIKRKQHPTFTYFDPINQFWCNFCLKAHYLRNLSKQDFRFPWHKSYKKLHHVIQTGYTKSTRKHKIWGEKFWVMAMVKKSQAKAYFATAKNS